LTGSFLPIYAQESLFDLQKARSAFINTYSISDLIKHPMAIKSVPSKRQEFVLSVRLFFFLKKIKKLKKNNV
jgi:hypothetical protein